MRKSFADKHHQSISGALRIESDSLVERISKAATRNNDVAKDNNTKTLKSDILVPGSDALTKEQEAVAPRTDATETGSNNMPNQNEVLVTGSDAIEAGSKVLAIESSTISTGTCDLVTESNELVMESNIGANQRHALSAESDIMEMDSQSLAKESDVMETGTNELVIKSNIGANQPDALTAESDVMELDSTSLATTESDVIEAKSDVIETESDVVETESEMADINSNIPQEDTLSIGSDTKGTARNDFEESNHSTDPQLPEIQPPSTSPHYQITCEPVDKNSLIPWNYRIRCKSFSWHQGTGFRRRLFKNTSWQLSGSFSWDQFSGTGSSVNDSSLNLSSAGTSERSLSGVTHGTFDERQAKIMWKTWGVMLLVMQLFLFTLYLSTAGVKYSMRWSRQQSIDIETTDTVKLRNEINKELKNAKLWKLEELHKLESKCNKAAAFLQKREKELHKELDEIHKHLKKELKDTKKEYTLEVRDAFDEKENVLVKARDEGDGTNMLSALKEFRTIHSRGGFNFSQAFDLKAYRGKNLAPYEGEMTKLIIVKKWLPPVNLKQVLWEAAVFASAYSMLFILGSAFALWMIKVKELFF